MVHGCSVAVEGCSGVCGGGEKEKFLLVFRNTPLLFSFINHIFFPPYLQQLLLVLLTMATVTDYDHDTFQQVRSIVAVSTGCTVDAVYNNNSNNTVIANYAACGSAGHTLYNIIMYYNVRW